MNSNINFNNRKKFKHILFLLTIVGLLIVLPVIIKQGYIHHIMIMIFIYAILSGAWNILSGFCGQVSLGNAIFFGIGAYTSSVLWAYYHVSPWIGMIAGGIIAAIFGVLLGLPIFRLRMQYLSIATIAVSQIIMTVFVNWNYVKGAAGLSLPLTSNSLRDMTFLYGKEGFYYISLISLILFTLVVFIITKTKIGYYFKTIKEEEDAAKSIGINTTQYKLIAMAFTSFFTAIAGTIYAQYLLYIDPNMVFSQRISFLIVLIAAFGGAATVWGPILGSFILIPINEVSRMLFGGGGRGVDLLSFGLLILLVALYRPEGMLSLFSNLGSPKDRKNSLHSQTREVV